jgi:eukaryotic-like serine/threonine-protein kinase
VQRTASDLAPRTPSERPGETTLGGRYRLVRLLGAGGMGRVYEAENLRTGRHVAVKVLDASRSADSAQVARFLQEARSAARLVHPNVVDVIDLDRDGELLFIVQELLHGEDLQSLLDARGTLSPDETVALALPALRGLAHAHEKGVVHRDIKPSNLFLAREADGAVVPKIIDFGISKITHGDDAAMVLTTTGEVFGTPAYMSPEQLRGARNVDARADVWAFGVLLYECLAGALPVPCENYNVLVHEVLSGRRRPLHEAAPAVPTPIADVVMRALAMDPADRYANAGALLEALTPFASTVRPTAPQEARRAPPEALAPTHPRPPAPTPAPAPRRWPELAAAGALATALLLVAGIAALRPGDTAPAARPTTAPTPLPAPVVIDAGSSATPAAAPPPAPSVEPAPSVDPAPSAHRGRRRHRIAAAPEANAPQVVAPPAAASPRPTLLTPGGAYPGP